MPVMQVGGSKHVMNGWKSNLMLSVRDLTWAWYGEISLGRVGSVHNKFMNVDRNNCNILTATLTMST